jgi:serpin B
MRKISLLLILIALSFSGISQNKFAFDIYSELGKESNILFSPTCIKSAFALAYEGANSETQIEFEKVFGFEEDNSKFIAEIEHLKSVSEISNSIWIMENVEILKSYTDKMKSSFAIEPEFTDFKDDSKGSAKRINDWIEKSTNGMIKDMLKPSDVKDFKMALVNAIYFKQGWKYTFDKKRTKKDEFTNYNGTLAEIDMMHSKRYYRAFDSKKEKVIELPYQDDKTSMVVILPNKMKGYEMTNENYDALISQLSKQEVNLKLPKFTFETSTFELKPFLKPLGMDSAFVNFANFSGMREENDLKIGAALHKAKIIVNEKGTEAAAATVIGMNKKTSISTPSPVMQLTVDTPFYYFIKDNNTGTILFMGRMNAM